MSVANGFPRISAVFFSVFDPEQGSKPVAQVPDGAVKQTGTSQVAAPFVSFDAIKNYIIPKPVLCNRLVSVLYKGYRVIGYPVNIVGKHYERNSFTFNFAFIFPDDADTSPYESIIVRTAKMFKALEEQSQYLSDLSNLVAIDSAMEQMFQDLNNFSECQIPIDESNKLDIKLLPIAQAPPEIQGYDVPVSTVKLSHLVDETWDPTLERLLPFINGINSVKQIADLASADYTLTKKGIQHLVHYGCVVTISLFQFSNMYAPTSAVAEICNLEVFQEFCDYVYKSKSRLLIPKSGITAHNSTAQTSGAQISGAQISGTQISETQDTAGISNTYVGSHGSRNQHLSVGTSHSDSMLNEPSAMLNVKQVFKLYTGFFAGLSLGSWYHAHRDLLQDIDLNKFLAFGVLKRLIYLVHSYPVWIPRHHPPPRGKIEEVMENLGLDPEDAHIICSSFEKARHFDELCTELRANRATVSKLLKSLGDWAILNK